MIYKTFSTDSRKLLSLPESGMGYQVVEGKSYLGNEFKRFIVYNCEIAIDLDKDFFVNQRKLVEKGFAAILSDKENWSVKTETIQLISRKVLYESRLLSDNNRIYKRRHSGGKGATENPREYADGNETFVRLSAFENDRRIDFEKKRLIEGTYSTTLSDYYDCIHTDDNPLDRYAIPNDEKINWAFYIRPKKIDILQRGEVQPAFGHEGGGIEVYFVNGTSEETFYGKRTYGG